MLYKLLIDGVVLLTICVFGLLANSITLYILNSGHEMRAQTINIYLSFLAIYDNGVLFSAVLMFCLPSLSNLWYLHSQGSVPIDDHFHQIGTQRTIEQQIDSVSNMLNSGTTTATIAQTAVSPFIQFNEQLDHVQSLGINSTLSFFPNAPWPERVERTERDENIGGHEKFERELVDDDNNLDYFDDDPEGMFENPSHYYISYVYPLAIIVQTGSIWTTCLVTIERYWAVTYPLRAMVLSTRKRALIALSFVSLASIVYNLPRFFEVEIKANEQTGVRMIVQTSLRLNETYRLVYYIALNLLLTHVIPLTTLTVLNFKIHKQIKAANINRAQLSASQRSELNVSSMLMVLVLIFIICNVPAFIVNVLEVIEFNTVFIDYCATISNVLVCINSSVNFLIYCIHTKSFRTKFIKIIACKRRAGMGEVVSGQPSQMYVTNDIRRRSISPTRRSLINEEISLNLIQDHQNSNLENGSKAGMDEDDKCKATKEFV